MGWWKWSDESDEPTAIIPPCAAQPASAMAARRAPRDISDEPTASIPPSVVLVWGEGLTVFLVRDLTVSLVWGLTHTSPRRPWRSGCRVQGAGCRVQGQGSGA